MFAPDAAYDARDRLLPASVPFRFFGAALVFHLAAWVLLAAGPDDPSLFAGGPGSVLAALHLATLGVLLVTAMGASFQLLPMATVRPVRSVAWAKACFWLTVPGVAVLGAGMALFHSVLLALGGVLLAAGVGVFAALLLDNLRSAGDMPVVRESAMAALGTLVATAALGLTLAFDLLEGILPDHAGLAGLHLAVAVYGFMGMLVAGFSTIIIPMLVIGPAPPVRTGRAIVLLSLAALTLVAAGLLTGSPWPLRAGSLIGLAAGGLHVHAMAAVVRARMRRRLGTALHLVYGAWAMLMLSLALGVLLAFGVRAVNLPALFGIVAVAGWLLPYLMAVLQRIAPFLASVHAMAPGGRPPLVSRLAPEGPLRLHAALHALAVLALSSGVVLENEALARVGATLGAAGAIALIHFAVTLGRRAITAARDARRLETQKKSGDVACST